MLREMADGRALVAKLTTSRKAELLTMGGSSTGMATRCPLRHENYQARAFPALNSCNARARTVC
jgi:hypothetical protein